MKFSALLLVALSACLADGIYLGNFGNLGNYGNYGNYGYFDRTSLIPSLSRRSLVDIAAGDPRFSTLLTAVRTAGLTDLLSRPGTFTVFAPTNAAFAKLPSGVLNNL